ncbi:DsbA family protein [Pedobacter sp. MC2016-14]|uniref:DsbA family protein n=1 Tax=Pedobacter sp. MC2016-14 TaxID=2897327 RepID=UPI001E556AEA|nr:DsbA family protein [Pedobacter sp. MC2016-14]MCD0488787.1 DsbA family protein [Pedobacter sp. MC2016-14]
MSKLIYIMDPLCGWCYGNSSNTQKLYDKYKNVLDFEILPAGMWTGTNARKQSKQMAQFIKKHDPQVQQTTGTEFGKEYFEFIENEEVALDSEVPSRAIVSIKKLWASQAIPFAVEVQKARYWYGKDLNEDETYLRICEKFGLDKTEFLQVFHSEIIKKETQQTFALAKQYASSYPTLLAEKEGKYYVLEQGYASFETISNRIDEIHLLN